MAIRRKQGDANIFEQRRQRLFELVRRVTSLKTKPTRRELAELRELSRQVESAIAQSREGFTRDRNGRFRRRGRWARPPAPRIPASVPAPAPAPGRRKPAAVKAPRLSGADLVAARIRRAVDAWEARLEEQGYRPSWSHVSQNSNGTVDAELHFANLSEEDSALESVLSEVDDLLRVLAITAPDTIIASNRDKYLWITGNIVRRVTEEYVRVDSSRGKVYTVREELSDVAAWQRFPRNTVIPTMRNVMLPAMVLDFRQMPQSVGVRFHWSPNKKYRPAREG
jgi:hypothetical protein